MFLSFTLFVVCLSMFSLIFCPYVLSVFLCLLPVFCLLSHYKLCIVFPWTVYYICLLFDVYYVCLFLLYNLVLVVVFLCYL